MTPQTEQRILENLYDRLWDAITYSPNAGEEPAFDKDTTLVQFSKGEALNAADFANAVTPTNPQGSLNAAEMFSRMVDVVPTVSADYAPTGNRLSETYRQIVDGANSTVQTDPEQLKMYKRAYDYLNVEQTITGFDGTKTTSVRPSPIYKTYQDNLTAYVAAVSAYRTAYLDYDLTDPKQQRQWQANEPVLRNAINQTYNTLQSGGAPQVREALAALSTTINSAVRNILSDAQRAMANQGFASSTGDGSEWYLAYGLPGDWGAPDPQGFSKLTLSSKNLQETTNSRFNEYGGGVSWNAGLWSVGGGVSGSDKSEHYHMTSDDVTISFRFGVVRILRPWLNDLLFRVRSWYTDATDKGGISSGTFDNNDGLLPLIPTAFVVARDLTIESNFTEEDKKHIEKSISGNTSVGWGPFKISGHYAHGSSKDTFSSHFEGGTLVVPGINVVAWISEITPMSPPESAPKAKGKGSKIPA